MSYKAQVGSVAFQTIEYLTTNPEEELTSEDIGIKFDKPSKQVHSLLAEAVKAGALKREENADEELVYRLGTGSPNIVAKAGRHASLHAQTPWVGAKPAAAGRKRTTVDVDAVAIEKDVPLITTRGRQAIDWRSLFKRMDVNHSCVLPKGVRGQLAKAAAAYKHEGLGEFAIRVLDDDALRMWRVK
jgi:hypothetical protein